MQDEGSGAGGEVPPRKPQQQWLLDEPTVGEVVGWYVENHVKLFRSRGSQKTYTWVLGWWVRELTARGVERPCGADLSELMAREVKKHDASGGESGCCPRTMNTRRRILGRCYHVARSRWRLLPDVTLSTECPPAPEASLQPRAIRDPARTWPLLLAVMPDAQARVLLRFQRELGLRIGEALGIEPHHLNFERAEVAILQQRDAMRAEPQALKTDTSAATLPMPEELVRELREAFRDSMRAGHRQTKARRRFVLPYYREALDRLMADVRRVSPADFPPGDAWHVFRHTFGTEAVDRFGTRLEVVQRLMRHKSVRTTQGYIGSIRGHYVPADDMRALFAARAAESAALASVPAVRGFGLDSLEASSRGTGTGDRSTLVSSLGGEKP